MNYPLISVLIPTYNVERFVEKAVRSIMQQTYPNLEIIVVDDGSTDSTYNILTQIAKEDPRIRVYQNERNMRIVKTLNYAISLAKGTFFARMDGDDISLPDRIMAQFKFLSENPAYQLVGLNVIMIDEEDREIHKETYPTRHDDILLASKFVSPIPHFWLATRNLYEQVGNYRIPSAEDYDFILRSLDAGHKVFNLPDFLYQQRIRQGNTSTALGLTQRKSISYIRKLHLERVQSGTASDSYSDDVLALNTKNSGIEKYLYDLSSKLHFIYLQKKKTMGFLAYGYFLTAILISPKHQLDQIFNRLKYKKLKQKSRTSPDQLTINESVELIQ